MKAKLTNIKDKLVDALNELTEQHLLAIFGFFMLALVICSMLIAPITASAYGQYPYNVTFTNPNNIPIDGAITINYWNGGDYTADAFGTHSITQRLNDSLYVVSNNIVEDGVPYFTITNDGESYVCIGDIPAGTYCIDYVFYSTDPTISIASSSGFNAGIYELDLGEAGTIGGIFILSNTDNYYVEHVDVNFGDVQSYLALRPIDDVPPVDECPTLEEQIADYDGSWYMFEQMLKANNYELWLKYSAELADVGSIQYSQGLSQGYQNGFSSALSGNSVEDPIDQYWNSTKNYILIAGQPYFTPNGFGSIDPYNTIGIYGEHESKLHKLDGSTQTFNGQYVTEFASTGTLGGGWYKLGATVGDEYAYEQTLTTTVGDKAYYVARVSPLGDPVEEFLVAIWVDGYEAWYVAEEYAHYGTVANNNKSYKQVYSIYMTDISPTSQRFVNYDNPILYETFNEDINATLFLATFNQLNNYNVYTDGIGIVEAYNNGYDTGANTTLWLNLISQPIVAFFSIPLAQVIIEGVTYTLTYGVVLGAGIVALIVIWFLKLFAGG